MNVLRGPRRGIAWLLIAALVTALAAGAVTVRAATTGWKGEAIVSSPSIGDGWEPAIAADPSSAYVYTAWMQYSGPSIYIYYRVSTDGGTTWQPAARLCSSCGKGEYDVTLFVTSGGTVYGTFMQGNHIQFTTSSNHGTTWSAPQQISQGTWADKPWMTASANGTDVYCWWSSHGNVDVVESHNSGATWTAPAQITSESNLTLIQIVEDLSYVFSHGRQNPWSVDDLRVRSTGFTNHLISTRDAFVLRNQDLLLESLRKEPAVSRASA